jgi:acyl-coenzyme A thioesterase PaaI-like protein
MDSHLAIMDLIHQKIDHLASEFLSPPPVFEIMQGEFLEFDVDDRKLKARFPVLGVYLNPYGSMQGGMIAAAVDNVLGPLSVLIAPPNVTRNLELRYSRPVMPEMAFIIVEAIFLQRDGQELTFKAFVRDPAGKLLARAKATHWIVGA